MTSYQLIAIFSCAILVLFAGCQTTPPGEDVPPQEVQTPTAEPEDHSQMSLSEYVRAFAVGEVEPTEAVDAERGLIRVLVAEDASEDGPEDGLERSAAIHCNDNAYEQAEELRTAIATRLQWVEDEMTDPVDCVDEERYCWFHSPGEYGAGMRLEFDEHHQITAALIYAADATLTGEFQEQIREEAFAMRDELAEQGCPER